MDELWVKGTEVSIAGKRYKIPNDKTWVHVAMYRDEVYIDGKHTEGESDNE